jgi:hypothetical protein
MSDWIKVGDAEGVDRARLEESIADAIEDAKAKVRELFESEFPTADPIERDEFIQLQQARVEELLRRHALEQFEKGRRRLMH